MNETNKPKYVMVDYENGVTDFLFSDEEVKIAIENIAYNYDNPMAVNDIGIQVFNVETGNCVNFELKTKVQVKIG